MLVAIDGSCDSRSAIAWLPQWLDSPNTQVTVASVVSDGATPDDIRSAWRRVMQGRDAISKGSSAHVVVLAGDTATALRHYAESNGVQVLVLGLRGEGDSPHDLGRVASSFARNSGLVVLYVEDDAVRHPARPT